MSNEVNFPPSSRLMSIWIRHSGDPPFRGVRRIGLTGLKPPPRNPPKKIIYSFKSGAFYVSQFVHPVADYVPPIQLINWANLRSSLLTTFRRLTCQILGYLFREYAHKIALTSSFTQPKMHQISLGGRAPPGPAGGAYWCTYSSPRPPSWIKGAYF